jgi:hypothetical protein
MGELLLPKIEKVQPGFFRSHPQHAASVLIDRHNGVRVEAIRVAFVVLKLVSETFSLPVKVI